MLWTLSAALLIAWVLGWGFAVAGNSIHVLLALALALGGFSLAAKLRRHRRTT